MRDLMARLFPDGEETLLMSESCKLQHIHSDNSGAFPATGKLLVTNIRILFSSSVRDCVHSIP